MNKLKLWKIIGIFIVFLLCFPLHFIYEWLPNSFFSIFLPVNESIWEHMKLIFTSYFLYEVIEYIILKKKNISVNNFFLQTFIVPIIGIIVYLIIFMPLYYIFGENMFISISLLFIVIVLEEIISYFLLQYKEIDNQRIIGIIGILLTYIIFGILTYQPLKNDLFYDTVEGKYGIDIYKK